MQLKIYSWKLAADGTPQLRTPQWHEKWYHLQPVHRAAAWPRQSLHCHFYFSSAPPPIVLCIGCSLRNIIEEKFWSWYKINVCKSARSPSLWYLNCEPITGPVLGWGLYWAILAILATGYWIMIWEQSPSPPQLDGQEYVGRSLTLYTRGISDYL